MARWRSMAASDAAAASRKTPKTASPSVLTMTPSFDSTASRMIAVWRALSSSHSAPRARARRIDPSTSVRRKVTVPVGRSIRRVAMLGRLLLAQSRRECRQQRHGSFGSLAQDRGQALSADDESPHAWCFGDDRRRPRRLAQDGQLADVIAGLIAADEPLAAIRLG